MTSTKPLTEATDACQIRNSHQTNQRRKGSPMTPTPGTARPKA